MIFVTRRRQEELVTLLEQAFDVPPGDVDWVKDGYHLDVVFVRELIRDAFTKSLYGRDRRWWQRLLFWRRPKKCIPIPCPPFEKVRLEMEEL